MKHLLLAATSLALAYSAIAAGPQGPDKKASYIIGHQIGNSLKRDGAPVDLDDVQRGMKAAMDGKPLGMEPAEVNEVMKAFSERIKADKDAGSKVRAQEAVKVLADFAKEEGVKTTKSGLMYKVLVPGKGASPKATDRVKVHYRGTLVDGKEFDSSHKRGQPAEFGVGGVIKGWTEALLLMQPGAKWKLAIPSGLAYGPKGNRGIGPNETLIFEVELLEILPPRPAPTKRPMLPPPPRGKKGAKM